MPAHLDEQIYIEDVNEQEEMSLNCWKVTHNFYQRLQHQGAPPELLANMLTIINHFEQAYEGFKMIRECFPPMDGHPVE